MCRGYVPSRFSKVQWFWAYTGSLEQVPQERKFRWNQQKKIGFWNRVWNGGPGVTFSKIVRGRACRQWRHQGGHWGIYPSIGGLPPLARLPPPVRKIKWPKSAIFGNVLDCCPLRITFCPLNASHRREEKIWRPHCLPDVEDLTFSILIFGLSSHPSVYHFRKKSTQFGQIWCFLQ